MTQGWEASAQAWIEVIGSEGDWGRRYVLDAPMLQRVRGRGFQRAVDIGCGEGRFCRMLKAEGIDSIGIDPTRALIEHARRRDPEGDYRIAGAEVLPLPEASCDLAVFYLSLIDIAELDAALAEAHRVLKPGGSLLIANLQGFNTAAVGQGWSREPDGSRRFCIDHYLEESVTWIAWQGIRIANHHRPMQRYLQALLALGFELRHFAEPAPVGVAGDKADRYRRAPNFLVMEWERR
jgi:SAM-dependent methyltransferase